MLVVVSLVVMSVLPHCIVGCDVFFFLNLIVSLVVMSILPHCIVDCDVFFFYKPHCIVGCDVYFTSLYR